MGDVGAVEIGIAAAVVGSAYPVAWLGTKLRQLRAALRFEDQSTN